VHREMNVLALVKNSERYVFLYDDESTESVLQKLGQYAADNELSFSWYDAAVLSQKVRRLKEQTIAEKAAVSSAPSLSLPQSAPDSVGPKVRSKTSHSPEHGSAPLSGLRFRGSSSFLP
jgi:hypothetical protein